MAPKLSPNLGLNYKWPYGEDRWNIGMDENLSKIDILLHLSVLSKDISTPPSIPQPGDRYIIGPNPTGLWIDKQNSIAFFFECEWKYYIPKNGWSSYVEDSNNVYIYDNNTWNLLTLGGINGIPVGGQLGQSLVKRSSSNFDVEWTSISDSSVIPAGGLTGYFLAKRSNTDLDLEWRQANQLPSGGLLGYVLVKNSNNDYDVRWDANTDRTPSGGQTGQFLVKKSDTDYDFEWIEVFQESEMPAGGLTGNVLVKKSDTDYDVEWTPLVSDNVVPPGGTTGQVLTKTSDNNFELEWKTVQSTGSIITGCLATTIPVSVYKVIAIANDGSFVYADSTILSHIGKVKGLSVSGAAIGSLFDIIKFGEVTNPSWNWDVSKSVYLSTDGDLTQDQPTVGFIQVIGIPLSLTVLEVDTYPAYLIE